MQMKSRLFALVSLFFVFGCYSAEKYWLSSPPDKFYHCSKYEAPPKVAKWYREKDLISLGYVLYVPTLNTLAKINAGYTQYNITDNSRNLFVQENNLAISTVEQNVNTFPQGPGVSELRRQKELEKKNQYYDRVPLVAPDNPSFLVAIAEGSRYYHQQSCPQVMYKHQTLISSNEAKARHYLRCPVCMP